MNEEPITASRTILRIPSNVRSIQLASVRRVVIHRSRKHVVLLAEPKEPMRRRYRTLLATPRGRYYKRQDLNVVWLESTTALLQSCCHVAIRLKVTRRLL